jgi:peptide/nickel transport system permease protein
MLEILSSDYVRTGRSKGLSEFAVIWRHALKNALIPVTTYAGLVLVRHTITGSVVVETVFGWPGIGRLAYEAVFSRDYVVVQALVLVFAIVVVVVNIVIEIAYRWLDPRIRKEM